MPTVDFVPFATGGGANVESQAAYLADSTTSNGFAAGLAVSEKFNKVWRQASFIAAGIANFVANQLNVNVLDDGNLNNFIANLTAAIESAATAGVQPARIYSGAGPLAIAVGDFAIGLNIAGSITANLPAGAAVGQEYELWDIGGNLSGALTVTVNPPGGATIAGLPSFVMNEGRQCCTFKFFGSNLWGVKSA